MNDDKEYVVSHRDVIMLAFIVLGFVTLAGRAAYLQLFSSDDLQAAGNDRYVRNVMIKPNRGLITDRNGETLAISTAVDTAWADPGILVNHPDKWRELARVLDRPEERITKNILKNSQSEKQFMYLQRHLTAQTAQQVTALDVPGVELMREYRRFYPHGPITASLLGFTDLDDNAQEGIELVRNAHLQGTPGSKRVIKDRRGRTVETIHMTRVEHGNDLRLSIDSRIQQLVYRELLAVLTKERAAVATSVVVHVPTGDILAIATAPSFNPNVISDRKVTRNQAVSDVFEPGSIAKPFLVAKALMQGTVTPQTVIDTSPGYMRLQGYKVEDIRNFGELSVEDVLMKSSNLGVVKIGLELDPVELLDFYKNVGFGTMVNSGLPGENNGLFPSRTKWRLSEHATLTYGYGFATTPLQLVQAYSALANEGVLVPLGIFLDKPRGEPRRVMPKDIALETTRMLERVVTPTGTSRRARIPMYRVAGKTATVQKLINGRYSSDQHLAMFVGYAPASNPQLAAVVIVDNPSAGAYYGGAVAAPVFRKIISSALRILNVPPDNIGKVASNRTVATVES